MTDDLCYLSATTALRLFRSRDLSPVELAAAVIARAEAVEPAINAFAATYYEQALEQARAAEAERYAGKGDPPRPLEGLLVAVKEEAPIAGQLNTLGSLPLRDVVAPRDGGVRAADPRRGRHRACPDDDAGVLLRAGDLDEAVGRHPQPVAPGLLARRVVRRLGRGAGRGQHDARDGLGHRRVDPHPGVVLRSRRVQAAVWPGAGGRGRSTSTTTATRGRWPARSPTARCWRT